MGTVELTCTPSASCSAIDCHRTYRVGDDEDVGLGGVVGGGLGEVADDGSVGVEQVWGRSVGWHTRDSCRRTVTGHAGLAGNASGDEDNLSALEGRGEAGGRGVVSAHLGRVSKASRVRAASVD